MSFCCIVRKLLVISSGRALILLLLLASSGEGLEKGVNLERMFVFLIALTKEDPAGELARFTEAGEIGGVGDEARDAG